MQKDPYTILGISRNATAEEIKKAYRKLAHQYHPDKSSGDEAKFKEVNEAYQILSDPKKRSSFDHFGFAYNDGGFQGGQTGDGGFSNFWDLFNRQGSFRTGGFEDIFDIFSDAFGASYDQRKEPHKGEDVYLELAVGKRDLGQKRIFEFDVLRSCPECDATGVAKGYKLQDCTTCHGTGQVRQSSRTPFGAFTRITVCPECSGKRKIPEKECSICKGAMRVAGKKKIEIHIPKDLADGYTVIVPQGGNTGLDGRPSGDLVIALKLK